ncbi:MAG: tetratricopeptide repeat protein [Candidatus Solibacter usitatus]|nr:tetratricopeptide repeat protein [Candidatus Solibacter usitatus]
MEGANDSREHPKPAQSPFLVNQQVAGRFRIVRRLAQGGMGIVYEAYDEKLDRRIALKCAKAPYTGQLPPEVRLASEVSHRNVCKIFEIHTASTPEGEIDFFTMEFLDGETLSQRLRRGKLAEAEARKVALQLCSGLAEAHRNRVIHGDLKSDNVILTVDTNGEQRAVITDFGLARSEALTGNLGGTPGYMAPELLQGSFTSVASDIYALGIIFHEMVSGLRPRERAAMLASTVVLEKGSPPPSPVNIGGVPLPLHSKWDSILRRCLDADPAKRFQSAREVADAIAPPPKRRRALYAAALVTIAAATGLVTYQRTTAPAEKIILTLQPFESSAETANEAGSLHAAAGATIAKLRGSARTSFSVADAGATHFLQVTLRRVNEKVMLRVRITDAGKQADLTQWSAAYEPAEMRYAPGALAGVVTNAFHLPNGSNGCTVSTAAREAYNEGLSLIRIDRQVDMALQRMQEAIDADPDSPLTHAGLAEARWRKYLVVDDPLDWREKSVDASRRAEIRNPDCAEVHRIAGLVDASAANYTQAIARFQRAAELNESNSDTHRRLAQAYRRNNQTAEALASYRRAVEMEPGYYRTHQDLGGFLLERANLAEAIRSFQKAVELAPNEPGLRISLATSLKNNGRFAEAERELRTALQLRESASSLYELGRTLMYQGKDREAVPYFERALKLDAKRASLWMYLGLGRLRMGMPGQAHIDFQRALQLVSDEVEREPRNGFTRSRLAYLCARTGDRARAESEVKQALALQPEHADVKWLAALTYELLGKRESALEILTSASQEMLADIGRWPEAFTLTRDPGFARLLRPSK